MRSPITTHVLDTAKGCPAAAVPVSLEFKQGGTWLQLGQSETDADGRVANLLAADHQLQAGTYRIIFATAGYHSGFFPEVAICFELLDTSQHYHIPLLLSPFGYSTYRGS